eukprot:373070_1
MIIRLLLLHLIVIPAFGTNYLCEFMCKWCNCHCKTEVRPLPARAKNHTVSSTITVQMMDDHDPVIAPKESKSQQNKSRILPKSPKLESFLDSNDDDDDDVDVDTTLSSVLDSTLNSQSRTLRFTTPCSPDLSTPCLPSTGKYRSGPKPIAMNFETSLDLQSDDHYASTPDTVTLDPRSQSQSLPIHGTAALSDLELELFLHKNDSHTKHSVGEILNSTHTQSAGAARRITGNATIINPLTVDAKPKMNERTRILMEQYCDLLRTNELLLRNNIADSQLLWCKQRYDELMKVFDNIQAIE